MTTTPAPAPIPPIAYEVRTPPLYWVVVAALTLASVGMLIFLLPAVTIRPEHQVHDLFLIALMLFGIALPALYFAVTREYRARGAIRLSLEHMEIPDPAGHPLFFAPRRTTINARSVTVRYLVLGATVHEGSRGHVLEFAAPGLQRRISTMTLVDGSLVPALLADLDRIQKGVPPNGRAPEPPSPPPAKPRDDYDDKLDQELAGLD